MTIKQYKSGIYFNMSDDEYFSIPALSCSGDKGMKISGGHFWVNSWMNSEKEQNTTPAMAFGKALHCAILEPDLFSQSYIKAFNLETYLADKFPKLDIDISDVLKSTDDLKEFMRMNFIKPLTGKKADLIDRIKLADCETPFIYDLFEADYNSEAGDRIRLSADDMKKIDGCADGIKDSEADEVFAEGASEVVLIWNEGDILMKAKLDKAAIDYTADLKSFSVKIGGKVVDSVIKDIASYNYTLQHYVYQRGREVVSQLMRDNKAYIGNENNTVDINWLNEFAKNEKPDFILVFIESSLPYTCVPIILASHDDLTGEVNTYYDIARQTYEDALAEFSKCMSRGVELKHWRKRHDIITLTDNDLPLWAQEY